MDGVTKDKRFSHIAKDPRFRHMPKHERKVKIDKRFKDMFSDKRFKLKYSVDKRGKPLKSTTNENLKKYYELSDSEDDSSNDDDDDDDENEDDSCDNDDSEEKVTKDEEVEKTVQSKIKTKSLKKKITEMAVQEKSENKPKPSDKTKEKQRKTEVTTKRKDIKKKTNVPSEDNMNTRDKDVTAKLQLEDKEEEEPENDVHDEDESDSESGIGSGPDLARGEGNVESSSSSEEEDDDDNLDDEDGEDNDVVHEWAELDKNVPEAQELGRRLAVCNMDWDRIKARDIFVLLQSFLPTGGVLRSVKIYPSEYGVQRMKEEEMKGPIELVQLKSKSEESAGKKKQQDADAEDQEGGTYHREKLRQYQLNRLKYFYAVVETDSIETANKIYEECDGMEYESSATKLDLRFIPDDMTFDQEVKSECTELPGSYKPNLFCSTALAQSKVDLTWDETDRDRLKVTMHNPNVKKGKKGKNKDDVEEEDMKAYLASSSDEDEGGPVDFSGEVEEEEEDKDEEAQINKYRQLLQSLNDDQEEKKNRDVQMEISWEPGLREATEKIVKKKEKHKDKTPWEEYLIKKREKKKEKKEERQRERMEAKAAKPDVLQKRSMEDPGCSGDDDDEEEVAFSDDDEEVAFSDDEEGVAFSDDELPGGVDKDDPFFSQLSDEEKNSKNKPKALMKKKNKKKDRRKEKSDEMPDDSNKAELALLMMDEEGEEDKKRHFNLKSLMVKDDGKKTKKKNKGRADSKGEKDDFKIDVSDPRFKAVYNSHLYNIDPSAKEFKKTKGMEAIIQEKLKRRVTDSQTVDEETRVKKKKRTGKSETVQGERSVMSGEVTEDKHVMDSSLANLISSVKTKTKNYQHKIKR